VLINKKNIRLIRSTIIIFITLFLGACTNMSTVSLPEQPPLSEAKTSTESPVAARAFNIEIGDTLRITRDAEIRPNGDDKTSFKVSSEGTFIYPYAGVITAAGKSLEAIASEITEKLSKTYKQPQVTVNFLDTPGNQFYVGGDVKKPSAFKLSARTTVEQAIILAGGVLSTANSEKVALLRLGENDQYNVYYINYSDMLMASSGSKKPVFIQRGDMIYVPKSDVGNIIETVDLYFSKLIPFNKGIGFNYDINRQGIPRQ